MTSRTGSDPQPVCELARLRICAFTGQGSHHAPTPRRIGLTLIEVLVSIAILASASVLVMQAFVRGAYVLALARNRLGAYTFASAKMADLELGFARGVAPKPSGQFQIGRDQFQWRVEAAPASQDPELELVTLTVDWHQGSRAYASRVSMLRRLPEVPP